MHVKARAKAPISTRMYPMLACLTVHVHHWYYETFSYRPSAF